jgi:hypothetical protein
MHDLRLRVVEGGAVPQGALEAAVRSIDEPDAIDQIEERLIVEVQVDASTPEQTILVPGRSTE